MTEILEAREYRKVQIRKAFSEIVKSLEHYNLLGEGDFEMSMEYPTVRLIVPVKPRDMYLWEELLHKGE